MEKVISKAGTSIAFDRYGEGQTHDVDPVLLAPVLIEFFSR